MHTFKEYFTENYKVTESPAFKEWFKGSKVVDSQGNPLVVYHGRVDDFNTFKDQEATLMGGGGALGHFGSSEQANKILRGWTISPEDYEWMTQNMKGKAPNIVPVYLSIKNPKRVEDDTLGPMWAYIIQRAKREGYDGLVYSNKVEGKGDSYVPFYPEQIKSATGNKGSFNPSNPDIRH